MNKSTRVIHFYNRINYELSNIFYLIKNISGAVFEFEDFKLIYEFFFTFTPKS